MRFLSLVFLFLANCFSIFAQENLQIAASDFNAYLPLIKDKHVGLIINHTSIIGSTHLLDTLINKGIKVKKIFAPEHGFRGNVSAGTNIKSDVDTKTGLPIISLYGKHKKPTKEDLIGLDVLLFDIQDVGVRFYTYISTMHYGMEAAAENNLSFIVLDRPNPNGHYFDGPILDSNYKSFVGMHPIPLVHGCTVGELAKMINGEGWLSNKIKCNLTVVPCKNYTHQTPYILPIKPSPNLQNQSAIYLYPSLGLFEGTIMSMGHGTNKPYQCFGNDKLGWGNYIYRPASLKGIYENPKFLGYQCTGFDLTWYGENKAYLEKEINLNWLLLSYQLSSNKSTFFTDFFEKLAGTADLRKQIESGKSAKEIKKTWQVGLMNYAKIRDKYLIYSK